MAEQTSQEPTMEEILASIRRIISEDEAPEGDAKAAAPHGDESPAPVEAAPEPPPARAAEPEPPPPAREPEPVQASAVAEGEDEEDDEPLELTQKVETHGDLDVYTPPPAAKPAPAPAPAAAAAARAESLVSDRAAQAAASAFGRLAASVAMPPEGRTLEDVVKELLRPLLHQWLDDHLPTIVQAAVEAEVARIARGRVG